jgi:hypothetical protein
VGTEGRWLAGWPQHPKNKNNFFISVALAVHVLIKHTYTPVAGLPALNIGIIQVNKITQLANKTEINKLQLAAS